MVKLLVLSFYSVINDLFYMEIMNEYNQYIYLYRFVLSYFHVSHLINLPFHSLLKQNIHI